MYDHAINAGQLLQDSSFFLMSNLLLKFERPIGAPKAGGVGENLNGRRLSTRVLKPMQSLVTLECRGL